MNDKIKEAIELAKRFHETYERLAPEYGYETCKESRKKWYDVPEKNRKLMIAVCEEILKKPPCVACGGLRQIPNPDNEDGAKEAIPCPACTGIQPDCSPDIATEVVDRDRIIADRDKTITAQAAEMHGLREIVVKKVAEIKGLKEELHKWEKMTVEELGEMAAGM